MKPKYSLKNKSQFLDLLKEKVDKALYQKEVKNLGIGKNTKNNNNNWKNLKGDSNAFSWRKGSSENGNNLDFSEKRYKKGYYNSNNYKKEKDLIQIMVFQIIKRKNTKNINHILMI